MSAGSEPAHAAADTGAERASESDDAGPDAGRRLRHGLISLAALLVLLAGLLLAVPGLHGVADTVTDMNGGLLAAAIALEVLSCLGYVLAFLQVFERAPRRFGARVALAELAFNSAVSLGGAGSVAVGAWMLVDRGAPLGRVAERSAVLFLLTSAINVITFVLAGALLGLGLMPGSHDPLLTWLPAGIGTAVLAFFLALPRIIDRGLMRRLPPKLAVALRTTATSIRATEQLLLRPDWRIIGAIGYLWFDIGVLIVCLVAAGGSLPLAAIVLAYQIAYLSNLIPVPGGIGVLDGSLVGMLVLYGAHATSAAAATVVYHAVSLWVPALWGTVAFVLARRMRGPLTPRPAPNGP